MAISSCTCEDHLLITPACEVDKPKGVKFVDFLEELGFKFDFSSFRNLLNGTYESIEFDQDYKKIVVKLYGYYPVTFYHTGESTLKYA